MTLQLDVATIITIVVPLLFLSLLGLASLARAFGYLKTSQERGLEEKINWMHDWAQNFNGHIVDIAPVISSITQLSGLVVGIKESSDKVAAVSTNQDFGLFALAARHRELRKCFKDLEEKIEFIETRIKKKTTAGLMEQILERVNDVRSIVYSHDASVKALDEAHPKAEFQKGERPVHWCSASILSDQMDVIADRAKVAVDKVDKVLDQRYEMDKDSLDNSKTMVSLLANVLSGVDGLKRDLKGLYDYIELDEKEQPCKK